MVAVTVYDASDQLSRSHQPQILTLNILGALSHLLNYSFQ